MRMLIGRLVVASLGALSLTGCFFANTSENGPEDAAASSTFPRAEQPANCPTEGAAIQVLGSGGPIAEMPTGTNGEARAATSYLLWIDGEPRLLIDAGSGSFLRYAQAGGKLATLDAILLTHVHADHAGDVIDVLNSGGFEGRSEPLIVAGPTGAPRFPSTSEFVARLLDKDAGAFAYNGGYGDGTENKPQLSVRDIETREGTAEPTGLDVSNDYSVIALPVDHAFVPALGYEISIGGKTVVITGDQSGRSFAFEEALRGSKPDILLAHHVINGEAGQPRGLHRTPAEIGTLAGALAPGRVVLTHNMDRSLSRIDDNLTAIGEEYSGPVSVAMDLDCYAP
ncbi:MBL fold metallo-hydrolase [Erythrobacter sp. Alg231-14]|uniref:MBL fold metallo-hydrolase n=1 Tax=Erythrobacter sp. Alg231-14 TaxID=1922225 RepID=UPI000D556FCA